MPETRFMLRQWVNDGTQTVKHEEVTIAAIAGDGSSVTIAPALSVDHRRGRYSDGTTFRYPHVFNLTRNVVFRSANPAGTRGHVMPMDMANVDVHHAAFVDLGRTLNHSASPTPWTPLLGNTTTYDGSGNPLVLASNQIGRYSLHMHRYSGPHSPQANGYQGTLEGCVVDQRTGYHAIRWAYVLHDTSYVKVKSNIAYNIAGAAFLTEQGNEVNNAFLGNAAVHVHGAGDRFDLGAEAIGFFFSAGFSNRFRDNVAAGVLATPGDTRGGGIYCYGLNYFGSSNAAGVLQDSVSIPSHQLAMRRLGGDDAATVDAHAAPMRQSENFECYTSMKVHTIWWHGTFGANIRPQVARGRVRRTIGWNINTITLSYPNYRLTFDGMQVVIDPAVHAAGLIPGGLTHSDYTQCDVTYEDIYLEGLAFASVPSTVNWGTLPTGAIYRGIQLYRDSTFRCYQGIRTDAPYGTSIGNYHLWQPTEVRVERCKFTDAGLTPANNFPTLYRYFRQFPGSGGLGHMHVPDRLIVRDAEGVPGDDFRVYHEGQAADYVVPTSAGATFRNPYAAPPAGTLDPDGVAYPTGRANAYWIAKSPHDPTWDVPFCNGGEVAPEKVGRTSSDTSVDLDVTKGMGATCRALNASAGTSSSGPIAWRRRAT